MNDIERFLFSLKEQVAAWFGHEFAEQILNPLIVTMTWLSSYTTAVAGWLWVVFVFLGLSLLFTAYYFRRQSKQLNHALASLYHINDLYNQDSLEFFKQGWPILVSVGCESLEAKIEWFGETKMVQKGLKKNKTVVKSYLVQREDMRFEILIGFSRDAIQKESVATLAVQTFIHILEQNLVIKQSEILTSQKRLERYQLFVQHEIKNIAQFIQMLSEQVTMVESCEAKEKLVNRLTKSLPSMAQRARKTIDHMQQPLTEFYQGDLFEIESLIQSIGDMYGLKVHIQGQASVSLPKEMLAEVFKNVLGNYRDHSAGIAKIQIHIKQDALINQVQINILSKQQTGQKMQSERMFEPFWTTSESGMGLGLFLARELLKQLDGGIEFFELPVKQLFGFQITLPSNLTNA